MDDECRQLHRKSQMLEQCYRWSRLSDDRRAWVEVWETVTPGVSKEREGVLVVTNMWTGWPATPALAFSQYIVGSQWQKQTAEELSDSSTVCGLLRVKNSSDAEGNCRRQCDSRTSASNRDLRSLSAPHCQQHQGGHHGIIIEVMLARSSTNRHTEEMSAWAAAISHRSV